ncbi:response regulator transcription factor [Calidifontibacillus oryziterrae]|uniref:response regulator transcription factor n=1 Tax=Calidifontibacillus oryziterrae TaxID=1191699 RepID=UPI00030466D6|nr:response regulator transcription factor [Calidifontibacillus oryziterrae]
MLILLVEDDKRLGNLVAHMLKKQKHQVDWVQNGEDAITYTKITNYDLIILDWMMPKKDGITVCKELRALGYDGAILMVTAKDGLEDRVKGLDYGADDYIVKPFEFAELFARIRALARRTTKPFVQEEILTAGSIKLNVVTHTVEKDGVEILLTPKEYQLLELFLRNPNQTLPRDLLIDRIWGIDSEVNSNNLDALVRLLRKKIEDGQKNHLIQNIRGVGYKIEKQII